MEVSLAKSVSTSKHSTHGGPAPLLAQAPGAKHTDNKASEKRINPPHNHGLWNHHHHIPLHHPHHTLHGSGIRHGIRSRLAPVLGILEEDAIFECRDEIVLATGEGSGGELAAIVA